MKNFKSITSRLVYEIKKNMLGRYRLWKRPQAVKIKGIWVFVSDYLSGEPLIQIYTGSYESNEIKILMSVLNPKDTVMELGTGVGLLSSYCAKKIGSDRIFTYEANPALEDNIRHSYALNNVSPTLEICLLGEQEGEQEFFISADFWSSSTIQHDQNGKAIKIPVKPFNLEVQKNNPTFLILDIEGGEYELVKYANFHNIQKILMECHRGTLGRENTEFVLSQLARSGFQVNHNYSRGNELFLERVPH